MLDRSTLPWFAGGAFVGGVAALAVGVFAFGAFGQDLPAVAMDPPRFVADPVGVDHVYDGEYEFFVGGGVAVFDCSGDGLPELYLAGGTQPAALYRNDSDVGGGLRFSEVADDAVALERVTGAYPLDVDGDAVTDLAVLRHGENVLYRGLGDCRFERANEAWGFDGGDAWTTAFSATWERGAEWPTLAVGNYLDLSNGRDEARCADSELIRPAADGAGFVTPTALQPGWCTLSVLFSDWDRSGRRDLRMSNDRHYYRDGQEQLWRIAPGEEPRQYTAADGWQPLQVWGMGIASRDLTGDGLPEVFLTSQGDNKLQTLVAGADRPEYEDIAIARGVTAHRPYTGGDVHPSTAWHAEFDDVNNDGFVDLYVAKGNVEAMPEFAARDPNNLLIGQPDGTYVEGAESAGIVEFARTRGAALADLNLDGMLDLVEVQRRERVRVWRNVGWGSAAAPAPMGNWAAVRLEQPGANRDAIGAWIEVRVGDRVTHHEVTVGGGHVSGQLGWASFGLGDATGAQIRVTWPDGDVSPWLALQANRYLIVERGEGAARPWTPPGQ